MTRQRRLFASIALVTAGVVAVSIAIGLNGSAQIVEPSAHPPAATAASRSPSPTDARSTTPPSAPPSPAPSPTPTPTPAVDDLQPGSVDATSLDLSATYEATIHVSFATRSFRVASTMQVTNRSGRPIDRLELNTVAARLGRMKIATAQVAGHDVQATVSDQTIHLPLGGILRPGATTTVRLAYRSTLRSDTTGSNWLFSKSNGIVSAYRWLPWISRPTPFDRPNHGDPFVTPVSPRVRVTIVADRRISWATTGEQTGATGSTTTFEAHDVRDFSIVGAPDFARSETTVDGVVIRVWGRPGFPRSTVVAAARIALRRESRLLGAYPYPTYDVAQTGGGFGMESPGLSWIPTRAPSLTYLVAHETAHQWFYGIVGNDQARQPFADEAATDFVARYVLGLRRAPRCPPARLDLAIYRYSRACYYEQIYIEGGNLLDDTRRRMGSTAFWAGIRDYLATNRFKIAGTKTLLDTLDDHTPLDLVPRFRPRFPGLY